MARIDSKLCLSMITLAILLTPAVASAFDGKRNGFVLGIGVGGQFSDIEVENENQAGVSASFRLGLGITDRLLLYYQNNESWYNRSGDKFLYSLSGIGASIYIYKTLPAVYFSFAVGETSYTNFDDDISLFGGDDFLDEGNGTGYLFGVGMELRKHVNLEAVVIQSDIEPDRYANEFSATSYQLYLNFLFY